MNADEHMGFAKALSKLWQKFMIFQLSIGQLAQDSGTGKSEIQLLEIRVGVKDLI